MMKSIGLARAALCVALWGCSSQPVEPTESTQDLQGPSASAPGSKPVAEAVTLPVDEHPEGVTGDYREVMRKRMPRDIKDLHVVNSEVLSEQAMSELLANHPGLAEELSDVLGPDATKLPTSAPAAVSAEVAE